MSKLQERYPRDKKIKIAVVSLWYFLLMMSVAAVQICIFPRFKFFGTVADAMLCTVVIVAFLSNEKEASLFAFFGGIVIEAMGSTGISLLPLIYFITAYFLGSAARYNHKKIFPSYLVFAAFGNLCPRYPRAGVRGLRGCGQPNARGGPCLSFDKRHPD